MIIMEKLGLLAYTYRKTIILFWVLAVSALSFFALNLPSMLQGSGFKTEGQFEEVESILKEDFNIPESSLIIVFEKAEGVDLEYFQKEIGRVLEQIRTVEGISQIISPFDQQDMIKGNVAYAVVMSNIHFDSMKETIEQIRSKLESTDSIFMGLTGGPVINEDMSVASQKDLVRAELIGVPIALVVLLFAFGGVVAASIPLMIGFITVLCSMGVLYFIGHTLNLSIFLLNVVPMIGLALGIDFALLIVNRFREELTKHPIPQAIAVSTATAGRAVIFSGVCVFLGLSGLLFIEVDIFQTVALGGMMVVLFSVISAITFLPALLSVIGYKINRLMVLKAKPNKSGSMWERFSRFVMRNPIVMSISVLLVLFIAIVPVQDIELTIPDAESLPSLYESRVAFEKYEASFVPENSSTVVMVVEGVSQVEDKAELEKLYTFIQTIQADPLVSRVESIFSVSGNLEVEQLHALLNDPAMKKRIEPLLDQMVAGDRTLLNVYLKASDPSVEAKNWVREWEQTNMSDYSIRLGGYAKFHQEIFDEIYNKVPYVLMVVFVSTFVVLFVAFRSILIPVKAILMNVASLCATFGILAWLFQGGHLGIEPANIGLMIPVLIFGIVFGLSMDYEVFLISRMHEIYKKTKDNDIATLEGLTSTSKIITSAALIIIVITGAFAFTGVVPVKQIGIGMALAILIDATVVRMILVPSFMKLFGEWNWWAPRFYKGRSK